MREEKKSIVEEIKKRLKGGSIFILTDYTGLSSGQMSELRSLLREKDSDYLVVKNRLFQRALDKETLEAIKVNLTGQMAIAIGRGCSAKLSKLLVDFARENEAPKIKVGMLEGNILTSNQIGTIASLPPRETLIAQFIGTMQGPVSGFAGILREMLRQFISVIDQITKKGDDR